MAKVSYVPYSKDYEDLFAFCGISLPTADFGGQTGWDPAAFAAAANEAILFLDNNMDTLAEQYGEETIEGWYGMLENYTVTFWSTEAPSIYG